MPEQFVPMPSGLQPTMPDLPAGMNELPDSARVEWLWQEYEKQMEEMKQYQEEGMDIFPTPGLVLKTILLSAPTRPSPQFPILTPSQSAKCKFFINLCSDPAIELPSMVPVGPEGEEQLRVPISVGPVELDVEKDGVTTCLVCDVVLNPDTISKASKEKEFRTFICEFGMKKLEEKYKIQLDGSQMKYPKMKYKGAGPPAAQHIRRPKKAHLEEERSSATVEEESIEERQQKAKLARIEALRAMEERESGLNMGKASTTNASGNATNSDEVFLSAQEAEAAAAQRQTPLQPQQQRQKAPAKIEVLSTEKATTPAAASSSASALSNNSSAPSAATASTLPAHTISYLKTLDSTTLIPPSEWDLDVGALPAAVRIELLLPGVSKASELDMIIHANGKVSVHSTDASKKAKQHWYELYIQLPFLLSEETCVCKFSKKSHPPKVTMTLPVTGKRPVMAEAIEEVTEEEAKSTQKIDWQEKLGLQNTLMWKHVTGED